MKIEKEDHPFPNKELNLIMDLNLSGILPVEHIAVISGLIHKYLVLRSYIFHGDDK